MPSTLRRIALLLSLPLAAPVLHAQGALFLLRGDLVQAQPVDLDLATALARVCRGPSATERAAGLESAVPPGTRLVAVRGDREALTLVFDEALLLAARLGRIETAIEQLTKTAFGCANLRGVGVRSVHLRIAGADGVERDLSERLLAAAAPASGNTGRPGPATTAPGAQAQSLPGALNGLRIAVSPGHGYYWHNTLGWTTQRGVIDGTVEDLHTAEICNDFLIPMLVDMGAEVVLCREHGEIAGEVIGDNDVGAPQYTETGAWTTSASSGYNGGGYRFAGGQPVASATATWTLPLPQDGVYPVYVQFRAGANRSAAARYRVHHTGGPTTVPVDQTIDDRTWVWLGDFAFATATGAVITLDNQDPLGGVVIADAVRVGSGLGSINSGGGSSGQLRWRECSRYWAQFCGAPSTVWNSIAGGQDNDDDVTCRPRFAEWRTADAFVSLHTNAGGGAGTSTYIHDTAPSAGSATLQQRIHTQLIGDLRSNWASSWTDRGQLSANFGEVRLLSTMPGVLIELAFHDTPGSLDLNSIHDPRFRFFAGRAIARGVLRYFSPTAPFAPDAPTALRVQQDGARGLVVAWNASAGATDYVVEWSPDGKGFVEAAAVNGTSWSTGPLPFDALWSFRVRARNGTGQSMPTEVLTAGTDHLGQAQVLLVQGFDRLSRTVPVRANSHDYLARFGAAIRDAATFSVGFDAASNDAVRSGAVPLGGYRAVIWALGEESTADETFDAQEQFLVGAYLAGGGRLYASGAEIAWDLDAQGTAFDRAFLNNTFGAGYLADDANTYLLQAGQAGGIFQGLPAGAFDNGTAGTYDVDFPDVLTTVGPDASVCLRYGNGQVAGVQRTSGNQRSVLLGFPFETITSRPLRAEFMRRVLRFLLDPLPIDCAETVALGNRLQLQIDTPADAGETYVTLCSFARQPGIPLPGGGTLPLLYTFLIDASVDPSFVLFGNFIGQLDGQGRAAPYVDVPPLPFLVGFPLYFSGLTVPPGPFVEDTVWNWVGTVIVP